MKQISHFWFPESAGATRDQLARLEMTLGVVLPAEYRDLMTEQDGGTSQFSGIAIGEEYFPLPSFLSVDLVLEAHARRTYWGTPEGVVVIGTGAHDWLGLDYRAGTPPSVVYQEDEDAELELVATTFLELLEHLSED